MKLARSWARHALASTSFAAAAVIVGTQTGGFGGGLGLPDLVTARTGSNAEAAPDAATPLAPFPEPAAGGWFAALGAS